MKPSTSLMIGMAPSLIRRVSSSAMPVLALPWRMAAYMRSSFRLAAATVTRMLRQGWPQHHRRDGGNGIDLSNLISRKPGRPPEAHSAAFLPLEHDLPAAQTAGIFLVPLQREPVPATLAAIGANPYQLPTFRTWFGRQQQWRPGV